MTGKCVRKPCYCLYIPTLPLLAPLGALQGNSIVSPAASCLHSRPSIQPPLPTCASCCVVAVHVSPPRLSPSADTRRTRLQVGTRNLSRVACLVHTYVRHQLMLQCLLGCGPSSKPQHMPRASQILCATTAGLLLSCLLIPLKQPAKASVACLTVHALQGRTTVVAPTTTTILPQGTAPAATAGQTSPDACSLAPPVPGVQKPTKGFFCTPLSIATLLAALEPMSRSSPCRPLHQTAVN